MPDACVTVLKQSTELSVRDGGISILGVKDAVLHFNLLHSTYHMGLELGFKKKILKAFTRYKRRLFEKLCRKIEERRCGGSLVV